MTVLEDPQVAVDVDRSDQFWQYHGFSSPFTSEAAENDSVFDHVLLATHHPDWDKFYGTPIANGLYIPQPSVVFGEKGSGKTALRKQAQASLERYGDDHPDARVFVIVYDYLTQYLDPFRNAVRATGITRSLIGCFRFLLSALGAGIAQADDDAQALGHIRLQDHMDGILSQGVTDLSGK